MPKLNQIVAIVNGKKTETKNEITKIHRKSNASEIFTGITRVYHPLDEDGETYPTESKQVQQTSEASLKEFETALSDLLDVVATQDYANCNAFADIKVNNNVIVPNVPVTYLMFLEKQLHDIHTFVSSLPVLDTSEDWSYNSNQGYYESAISQTNKTKKVPQHKVLYEATKEHPAQIETWTEDVKVGTWHVKKFSGAISKTDQEGILSRIKQLQTAVKFAREEANSVEVENKNVASKLFAFMMES